MDQERRKHGFGMWLRRAWNAAVRAAEALERTPFDELFSRIGRLEREMAALQKDRRGLTAPDQECATKKL